MREITVVGGGIGGLVAAIECAEAGAPVRLLEARSRLGGRASTAPGPFLANLGPHALYTGGSLWAWLEARGLHHGMVRPMTPAIRFRWKGEIRRTPPAALVRALPMLRGDAPVDVDLHTWVASRCGDDAARAVAGACGALTFDHDPGRLSAAFVAERIRRILLPVPPVARYVPGGWAALVDRLATHARTVGVRIVTDMPVTSLDDVADPVVLAVEPGAARRLLGDDTLRPESPRVVLLDVGLVSRRRDPYLVVDLDEAAFVDRFTAIVPSLAPDGHELVQACVGLRPGEEGADGEVRLERVLDGAFAGWRERTVWRRRAVVRESTGALDLPGRTWRDRTPIAVRPGVWLAGDWVAAPGHLAEVSCASAVAAAHAARSALAEEAVAGVAQAGDDERPLVEAFVDRGRDDPHTG